MNHSSFQRVLVVNEGWVYAPVFSLEFVLEFFKRYGADPVMFPGGITRVVYTCTVPTDTTSIPGWIVHQAPVPVFENIETGEWVYTPEPYERGEAWRTDPRVLALVEEMGIYIASHRESLLMIEVVPKDCTWEVVRHTMDSAESVKWTFPTDRVIRELRALLRGVEVPDLHPYTQRLLADDMLTPDQMVADLERDVQHARQELMM
jgi:hypothetical protein